MTSHSVLYPRRPVPPLVLDTVGGGRWSLHERSPERFTLLVFYRGLHCPICAGYLADLDARLTGFAERGVEVIAISMDTRERAERTRADWNIDDLTLGYGLTVDDARGWGLFLSTSRGKTSTGVEEPELFSEPATYLVRSGGELYFGSVQTMPFARPDFGQILGALDFVIANDYPGRGEVTDEALEFRM